MRKIDLRNALAVGFILLLGGCELHITTTTTMPPPGRDRFANELGDLFRDARAQGLGPAIAADLGAARSAYDRRLACDAAAALEAASRDAQPARAGQLAASAEDAFNRISALRASLLAALDPGRACPSAKRVGARPRIDVLASDDRRLQVKIDFGEPLFITRHGGAEIFTEVEIPGVTGRGGQVGTPALPLLRRLIAVPRGARTTITTDPVTAAPVRLRLHPIQPVPVDGPERGSPFDSPPFVIDARSYRQGTSSKPLCTLTPAGVVRGVELAEVTCPAAVYAADTDTFTPLSSIAFEVQFRGGKGFIDPRAQTSFNDGLRVYTQTILNRDAIPVAQDHTRWPPTRCAGEEMLVLAPGALLPAATDLAAWRTSRGVVSRARSIDKPGGGSLSRDEIHDLINQERDTCVVEPSYVLLFGDADTIAPYYAGGIATDYPYGLHTYTVGAAVGLPELAMGRIPVGTLEQANGVVAKIKRYEQAAPVLGRNVAIASYFQAVDGDVVNTFRDKRTFLSTSEMVRTALLVNGYTVERIYTRDLGPSTAPYATPSQFDDGTALPAALGPGSGFAWSGATADITAAFNSGQQLVLHRDHGGPDGWASPSYSTTDASDLTNSVLPFVFSVNCASGYFDGETDPAGTPSSVPHFVETLLRNPSGGAVAVIGDTRNSPSWHNSMLTRGYFDALWTGVLDDYGSNAELPRLGDILNYGKGYLASLTGITDGNTQQELLLYHAFGDPTLEFRYPRDISKVFKDYKVLTWPNWPDPDPWMIEMQYPVEGAELTLYQVVRGEAQPVARGTVAKGVAVMSALSPVAAEQSVEVVAKLPGGGVVSLPAISGRQGR